MGLNVTDKTHYRDEDGVYRLTEYGRQQDAKAGLIVIVFAPALFVFWLCGGFGVSMDPGLKWLLGIVLFILNIGLLIWLKIWWVAFKMRWSAKQYTKGVKRELSDGGDSTLNVLVNTEKQPPVVNHTDVDGQVLPAKRADVATQIGRLKVLLDSGALTQSEFDDLKGKIIGSTNSA